ncbi:MAG TPA: response regulator, partial [Myxococcales bacterium]|nr:response regulator [Myxococcales bacterium]
MAAILLVDDEPAIRESLAFALRRDGFEISQAASLREARARVQEADLVILDLVLPDGNGLEFLRSLRARSDVPVIILTSRDEETDRVVGLEIGADNYVLKPFSPREVSARVRAVLRRASRPAPAEEEHQLRAGRLSLDLRTRKAAVGQTEMMLSRTEFNLLAAFLRSPGRVFERSQILDAV